LFALRNPLEPLLIPQFLHLQSGILKELPKRHGDRPKVVGIAPQRQLTQQANVELYKALSTSIERLVHSHSDYLYLGTSCFEKHSIGIFAHQPSESRPTCNGEICHAHPSDGSMHLTLHPADVKTVIDQGWGERHPLAWKDRW
jgi:hypothetical protein